MENQMSYLFLLNIFVVYTLSEICFMQLMI